MHGWSQDLRYALRMLRTYPAFSIVAVIALALGIGANTAVFTVVNGVLLRPLSFPNPGRLVLIADAKPGWRAYPVRRLADRDYLALRKSDRALEALATFDARGIDLAGAGEPTHLAAAAVTADFFRALGVVPSRGRGFTAADEGEPVAIIGESLWRERFGSAPDILGTSVRIDGVPHRIVGVMQQGFSYPDCAQVWMPLAVRADRIAFLRPAVGRLRPGASAHEVAAELQAVLRPGHVAVVEPFQELMVGEVRRLLLVFDGAVGFVLLIACANVANLLLIRTASRRQEMAVRGAMGASAGRLARQLLTESAVLAVAGGVAGLLLATWGVPVLLALAPAGAIPRASEVHVDGWVMAFTAAVSAVTGLLFGFAPLPDALRRDLRSIPRRARLRSGLAVAEVALALILLAGGGLMLKSALRMRAVDPGFHPENVLALDLSLPDALYRTPAARLAFENKLLEELGGMAGVDAVGAVDISPLSDVQLSGDIRVDNGGAPLPAGYAAQKLSASPGYFRAMGIRLLRGRDFEARDDAGAARVAIVSESVARAAWPGRDAVGKRIAIQTPPKPEDWLTVVGVVQDVRQFGPTLPASPAVYRPLAQSPTPVFGREVTFVAHTAIDSALIAPAILRRAVADIERSQAIASLGTMQDRIDRSVAEPVFQTRVLAAFAIMALLLAAVGIYGVGAFSVAERTREIGIRIALGAGRREILRDVLGSALMLAATGVALGTAGAFAATRALASFLFEVKPGDPSVFAAVAALLALVALLAGCIPARRATRVDPVVALRYE